MKKWYDEEYEFNIEVTGFLHGDHTERYCRNGEEIGDKYTCTYGCPVNKEGYGICSKTMMMLYPLMEAVRSGGDLTNLGGDSKYTKTIVCPDGCVIFKLTATPLGNENFHKGGFWEYPDETQQNYPNGDYHFFYDKDWKYGLFGHPQRKQIIVIGKELIEKFERHKKDLDITE